MEYGGWTEKEHFAFMYCMEQYTHDLSNRRTLYIDRMKRHFPKKTRADIVSGYTYDNMFTAYDTVIICRVFQDALVHMILPKPQQNLTIKSNDRSHMKNGG